MVSVYLLYGGSRLQGHVPQEKERARRKLNISCDPNSEVTQHHFHRMLFVREPISKGRDKDSTF